MKWKKWIGLIIFLGIIAFIGVSIFASDTEEIAPEVRVAEVSQKDIAEIISTTGTIQPIETQEMNGEGIVSELAVSVGDSVEEGETLLTYADEANTQIEAAFSGTVIEVNASEGDLDTNIQQGQPTIVIADLSQLQVEVEFSRSDANRIKAEQSVLLNYTGEEFNGYIHSVEPIARSESGSSIASLTGGGTNATLHSIIRFDSDVDNLIAGFDIDADIEIASQEGAIVLPIEALNYNSEGAPYVYTVEDNTVNEKEIETGIQSNADIEVTQGLQLGDQVILSPDEEIEDGINVDIEED